MPTQLAYAGIASNNPSPKLKTLHFLCYAKDPGYKRSLARVSTWARRLLSGAVAYFLRLLPCPGDPDSGLGPKDPKSLRPKAPRCEVFAQGKNLRQWSGVPGGPGSPIPGAACRKPLFIIPATQV